jgi:hypothetical protein
MWGTRVVPPKISEHFAPENLSTDDEIPPDINLNAIRPGCDSNSRIKIITVVFGIY